MTASAKLPAAQSAHAAIVKVFGAKLNIRQKNFYQKYIEHLLMEKSLFRLSLAAFFIKISLKNVVYLLNLLELEKTEIL